MSNPAKHGMASDLICVSTLHVSQFHTLKYSKIVCDALTGTHRMEGIAYDDSLVNLTKLRLSCHDDCLPARRRQSKQVIAN